MQVHAALDRNLACRIARRISRLIRTVMFFVDDNQAQIGNGSEYGAARTDNDARFFFDDSAPLRKLLAPGKCRMQHGLRFAEACRYGLPDLLCSAYFGHQINNTPSFAKFLLGYA